MRSRPLISAAGMAAVLLALLVATPAMAQITPSRDANAVAGAVTEQLPAGTFRGASFPTIPPPPSAAVECSNGEDDDGDGTIDFAPPPGQTADPGCEASSGGAADNREQDDAPAQCANGFDDDGDGTSDFSPPAGETADPGCSAPGDDNEIDGEPAATPQCSNGDDDDGDGRIDAADSGCRSAGDLDEGSEGLPPGADSDPAAVAGSGLAGFPTSGTSYAILSSGSTRFADDPNASEGTSQSNGDGPGTSSHGERVHDLVTLRVGVNVPVGMSCLRLDFRFLSEEFPEYVGGTVNDAFVAELDASDFTVNPDDSSVNAPRNFAVDSSGNLISVNTAAFAASEAAGTTYDGATPRLRASTPITPGSHSVYLSVFDHGDSILDSAAFIDALRLDNASAENCRRGATSDLTPPTSPDTTPTSGGDAPASQPVAESGAPPQPEPPLPPLVTGRTVNLVPVSGVVTVRLPDGGGTIRLEDAEQVPTGSVVDTRKGTVRLFSTGRNGRIQSALFFDGLFRVTQTTGSRPVTQLTLVERFARCPRAGAGRADSAAIRRRRLWGDGTGSFRTRGRRSATTVSGTKWLVEDSCAGTLTRVTRGVVRVRDFGRRKTVTVRAGRSYRAR